MRLLAIDLGDRRIGLAISDPTGTIASPVGHLMRRLGKRAPVGEIIERAKALEAEGFVVGLPLNQEGDETERSGEARRLAMLLGERSGLPVRLDEHRTARGQTIQDWPPSRPTVSGRRRHHPRCSAIAPH